MSKKKDPEAPYSENETPGKPGWNLARGTGGQTKTTGGKTKSTSPWGSAKNKSVNT